MFLLGLALVLAVSSHFRENERFRNRIVNSEGYHYKKLVMLMNGFNFINFTYGNRT